MRGVFIAEPSVAGFGRQLLNTVVEQVLKKSPAFCFLVEEHPAAKERVPALPGWRDCAGCGVGISQRVLKGVGMCCELENNVTHNTFIASIWSSPSQQQSLIVCVALSLEGRDVLTQLVSLSTTSTMPSTGTKWTHAK